MRSLVSLLLMSLVLTLSLAACASLSESKKHYNAGVDLHEQGRLQQAIEEYTKAIELDPKHAVAYNNLARAALRHEAGAFPELSLGFR